MTAAACDYYATGAGYCGATPTRQFLNGTRCAEHTPARVAGHADVVPPHVGTLAWFLERAGRWRRVIGTPQSASTLIDDRAVASGKSSRGAHAYAEAKMREQERRAGQQPDPPPAADTPDDTGQAPLWDAE